MVLIIQTICESFNILLFSFIIWKVAILKAGTSNLDWQLISGLMHDTGCLGLVHWDDPEGWYGEGGGFRMGNTCIPVADSF